MSDGEVATAENIVAVGIALGSNEGERLESLRVARKQICELPEVEQRLTRSAPIYETSPVDCPVGTEPFLNTTVEIFCPARFVIGDLLGKLRAIETMLGRPARHPKNMARPIDLDILYAGDAPFSSADLTLPHPRMAQRRFVLQPLAMLRPDLRLPGFVETVAQLLQKLPTSETVTLYAQQW